MEIFHYTFPGNESSASIARWLTLHNCTALTRSIDLGRSSHIASERTHRELRLQHLFYCCVTSPRTCLPSRYIATAVHVTYRDTTSIVACGHYLATAVSLAPQFLLRANTPEYVEPEVITKATIKSTILSDVTPYGVLEVHRRFGEISKNFHQTTALYIREDSTLHV
jgi:hypothetical protein